MTDDETSPSWTTRLRVRSYELDSFGHVNHAVFLNYLEQARFEALEAGGFPPSLINARGWGVHVVRVEVDYRSEAVLGDPLVVRTRVEALKSSSMILRQVVRKESEAGEGELVAEGRVVLVWVGSDRRPMRIPDPVREALSGA